jgi:hypothetical protein
MSKFVITVVMVTSIYLQAGAQKVSFGIQAGLSLANMHETYDGESHKGDFRPGAIIGATSDIPIAEHFNFQPSINFLQKGSKQEGYNYTEKITLNYIEIPFNISYYHQFPRIQVFAGAGPAAALAISGKEEQNKNGTLSRYTLHFGNNPDEDDLRSLDFGANFLTGVKLKNGLFLRISYNHGMCTLIPAGNEHGTLKNNYLGFSLGYMFQSSAKD